MALVQSTGGADAISIEAQARGLDTASISLRASGRARRALS
jgi:hypothetical protein